MPAGVDGFSYTALDASGNPVIVASEGIIGLTFGASGTFGDTITASNVSGNIFILTNGQNLTTYVPNAAVSGAGNNSVFLGGTGQTFSSDGNAVLVVNAGSTVWTNGGVYSSEGIFGTGNAVGLGASIDLVWDNSGGGNSVIPRAGDITLIGGPGLQNDSLNLSNILGATQWDGSGSTLLDYLHIVPTGAPEWPAAIGYSTTANGTFQLAAFVENMTPQQVAAHVGVL